MLFDQNSKFLKLTSSKFNQIILYKLNKHIAFLIITIGQPTGIKNTDLLKKTSSVHQSLLSVLNKFCLTSQDHSFCCFFSQKSNNSMIHLSSLWWKTCLRSPFYPTPKRWHLRCRWSPWMSKRWKFKVHL